MEVLSGVQKDPTEVSLMQSAQKENKRKDIEIQSLRQYNNELE